MKLLKALENVAWISLASFVNIGHVEAAQGDTLCAHFKKEKVAAAYLIDKDGHIQNGPINFGTYFYTYKPRDFVLIPTEYRLIIAPARIKLSGTGEGIMGVTAVLKPVKNICPNSKTYSITYSTREAKSNDPMDAWSLPFKENVQFEATQMEDPKLEMGDFVLNYRFDTRIVGTIVDGTKK